MRILKTVIIIYTAGSKLYSCTSSVNKTYIETE